MTYRTGLRLARVAAALLLLLGSSCLWHGCLDSPGRDTAPDRSPGRGRNEAPPASGRTSARGGVFCLGRIPFQNPSRMIDTHGVIVDRIARRMGYDKGIMVSAPDYDGVLALLLDGKIDAAWMGTVSYARAVLEGKRIEPIACPRRRGKAWYTGDIVCRKDSGVSRLEQLKGRRIAFVDEASASGYLYPLFLLERAGVRIDRPVFLGKHDSVLLAVYLGKFDAGAVFSGAVRVFFADRPERQREMCVLATTERIYNEPIVVRADAPAEWKRRLKEAFLSLELDSNETAALGGLEGFESTDAEHYLPVVRLLKRLKQKKRREGKSGG